MAVNMIGNIAGNVHRVFHENEIMYGILQNMRDIIPRVNREFFMRRCIRENILNWKHETYWLHYLCAIGDVAALNNELQFLSADNNEASLEEIRRRLNDDSIHEFNYGGCLHTAVAWNNDSELVGLLIAWGADIRLRDRRDDTPLESVHNSLYVNPFRQIIDDGDFIPIQRFRRNHQDFTLSLTRLEEEEALINNQEDLIIEFDDDEDDQEEEDLQQQRYEREIADFYHQEIYDGNNNYDDDDDDDDQRGEEEDLIIEFNDDEMYDGYSSYDDEEDEERWIMGEEERNRFMRDLDIEEERINNYQHLQQQREREERERQENQLPIRRPPPAPRRQVPQRQSIIQEEEEEEEEEQEEQENRPPTRRRLDFQEEREEREEQEDNIEEYVLDQNEELVEMTDYVPLAFRIMKRYDLGEQNDTISSSDASSAYEKNEENLVYVDENEQVSEQESEESLVYVDENEQVSEEISEEESEEENEQKNEDEELMESALNKSGVIKRYFVQPLQYLLNI